MSWAVNHVTIGGNLVRDPEIRYVGSGSAVCKVAIAVNQGKKGEEKAMFVDIVAWEKTAETLNTYFRKGKPILVEGRLDVRNYEDKDGVKRKAVEVVVSRLYFLPKNEGAGSNGDSYSGDRAGSARGFDDGFGGELEDEIPF